MAGGVTTPALAAAVANAGGIGSFGFAYSTPEKIAADLRAASALRSGSSGRGGGINANFFVYPELRAPPATQVSVALAVLAGLPGGAAQEPQAPYHLDLAAQLEAVWENPPDLLTFHFGIPPAWVIARAHGLGILVGISATCIEEALAVGGSGADFIVAQGFEAGGHRGMFDCAAEDEALPVLELVSRLRDTVSIPVVAAGGIMDGAGIASALRAGAVAAQLGTAFLTCSESGTSKVYREYLIGPDIATRGTAFTRGFSGRPARGIVNTFMTEMVGNPTLPFPLQNTATGNLRKAAAARGDGEYQSLWAGTNFKHCRVLSASELVEALVSELELAHVGVSAGEHPKPHLNSSL